jgi:hypothetical protein
LGIGSLLLVGVLVIGTVAALAMPGTVQAAPGLGQGGGPQGGGPGPGGADAPRTGPNSEGTYGALSASEIEALQMALDDEYKAWSVYEQVIADFGAVRPFTGIQRAEENHTSALVNPFTRYGLAVPENEWLGKVPSFDTLGEACAAGVQAEAENKALYVVRAVEGEERNPVFGKNRISLGWAALRQAIACDVMEILRSLRSLRMTAKVAPGSGGAGGVFLSAVGLGAGGGLVEAGPTWSTLGIAPVAGDACRPRQGGGPRNDKGRGRRYRAQGAAQGAMAAAELWFCGKNPSSWLVRGPGTWEVSCGICGHTVRSLKYGYSRNGRQADRTGHR